MWKKVIGFILLVFLLTACSSSSPTSGSTYFTAEDLTGFITHDTLGYQGPDPRFGIAEELDRDQQISIVGASVGGKYALIEDRSSAGKLYWVNVDSIEIKSNDLLRAFEIVSIMNPNSSDEGSSHDALLELFMKLNMNNPDSDNSPGNDDGMPYFEKVPQIIDCTRNSAEEMPSKDEIGEKVMYCDPEDEPGFFEAFFQLFSDETGWEPDDEPGFFETFLQQFGDEPEDGSSETENRTIDDQDCVPLPTATTPPTLNSDEAREKAAADLVDDIGGFLHGMCGNFLCHSSDTIDAFLTECGDLVYPVIYFPREDCSEKSGCVTSTPPPVEFIPCTPMPTQPAPIILNLALCWNGPGPEYEVISSLHPNTHVDVLGTGTGSGYIVITNPSYNRPCWVKDSDIELNGLDLSNMPIYEIPDQSGSSDSSDSGCWVKTGRSDPAQCVSPCPDPEAYPDICEP